MRGMGLPKSGSQRGDLIVELRIVLPASLSDEETKLFEDLRKASAFDPRNK
jgi:curved DNA-binding protein